MFLCSFRVSFLCHVFVGNIHFLLNLYWDSLGHFPVFQQQKNKTKQKHNLEIRRIEWVIKYRISSIACYFQLSAWLLYSTFVHPYLFNSFKSRIAAVCTVTHNYWTYHQITRRRFLICDSTFNTPNPSWDLLQVSKLKVVSIAPILWSKVISSPTLLGRDPWLILAHTADKSGVSDLL